VVLQTANSKHAKANSAYQFVWSVRVWCLCLSTQRERERAQRAPQIQSLKPSTPGCPPAPKRCAVCDTQCKEAGGGVGRGTHGVAVNRHHATRGVAFHVRGRAALLTAQPNLNREYMSHSDVAHAYRYISLLTLLALGGTLIVLHCIELNI
jgi:hypothetical protein